MVVLEGDAAVVVLVAVGFDREAVGAPEEVDGVGADGRVDLGGRQAVATDEGAEVPLELAASAVALQARVEAEAAMLRLADRLADELGVERAVGAEVEERAVRGGERDAGAVAEVAGRERGAVDADPGAATPAVGAG